jgi:hypothetical protein
VPITVFEIYFKNYIPVKNGKELTSTVNILCAEYSNGLQNEKEIKEENKNNKTIKNWNIHCQVLNTA